MKHIAAVLLLALAEKEINEKNINEVLTAAGAKPNENCVKLLVKACKGKKCDELIKEGAKKLVAVVAAPEGGEHHEDHKDDKKGGKKGKEDKKKKKEKPKEEEEEEDLGFGGLF